jgi:FAD:protein FMN transferase
MKSLSKNETRRCRPLLGTFVEIALRDGDSALREVAFSTAFAAIEKVQCLMSFFEDSSDVSRLNREAFKKPVRVHDWTWRVLAQSENFAIQSEGAFDITVAPLLSKWGYLPNHYEADSDATFRDIILGPDRMVQFARPLSIDLGGIAKGFAVDRAVEALQEIGIRNGTINAGGDLRIFGTEPQRVYIRDPANPMAAVGVAFLRNRAIATSGTYFTLKVWSNMTVSPLIDPTSARALITDVSVAVSAPNCLTADALTKIVLNQRESSRDILRGFRADAVILERDKTPHVLSGHASQLRQAQ